MFFGKRNTTGEIGERLARKFLRKLGWRIVKKNLRVGRDEIDILAVSPMGDTLALVEVRSTENPAKDPRETVRHQKRRCMLRAARQLRSQASIHECTLRIDLITVNLGFSPPRVVYFEKAIPLGGCI